MQRTRRGDNIANTVFTGGVVEAKCVCSCKWMVMVASIFWMRGRPEIEWQSGRTPLSSMRSVATPVRFLFTLTNPVDDDLHCDAHNAFVMRVYRKRNRACCYHG